eukprot:gene5665-11435_t
MTSQGVSSTFFAREQNLIGHAKFRSKVLGSPYFPRCYDKSVSLSGHGGCVNSILIFDDGRRVITGSDDTKIKIFELSSGAHKQTISTIHTNNIFYAKDLPESNGDKLVSCAADGRVVQTTLSTMGSSEIHRHMGRAHRLALYPGCVNLFFSCGEDGKCILYDLRTPNFNTIDFVFRDADNDVCSIYGLSINPFRPNQIALCGAASTVQTFDSRMSNTVGGYMSPHHLSRRSENITGIAYNYSGDSLVATYNDEHIYTFDTNVHVRSTYHLPETTPSFSSADTGNQRINNEISNNNDTNNNNNNTTSTATTESTTTAPTFSTEFSGHRNEQTVKQVSFMGLNSEFIVSGSDCGHVFMWNSSTGKLVTMFKADEVGAVNCLTPHPDMPILATSGLEHDAKIWYPNGRYTPLIEGSEAMKSIKKVCKRNESRRTSALQRSSSNSISPQSFGNSVAENMNNSDGDDESDTSDNENNRNNDEDEDEDDGEGNEEGDGNGNGNGNGNGLRTGSVTKRTEQGVETESDLGLVVTVAPPLMERRALLAIVKRLCMLIISHVPSYIAMRQLFTYLTASIVVVIPPTIECNADWAIEVLKKVKRYFTALFRPADTRSDQELIEGINSPSDVLKSKQWRLGGLGLKCSAIFESMLESYLFGAMIAMGIFILSGLRISVATGMDKVEAKS